MTIPHLKLQELIDYLKKNGCEIVSSENWNDFDRIILEKDGITFPLQTNESVYYYWLVNKICEDLGIDPPEECKKVGEQIKNQRKKN